MIRVKALLDLLAYAAALVGTVPLYPYLDRPVQAFLPVALFAGIYCDRLGRHPLRGWPVTVLSVLLFTAYALQISQHHVVPPVVHILALLLAIRLAAAKEGRHYLQIFVLAVIALAGSTLLSLSPLFFPGLVLLVTCLTAGLVLLTFHDADPQQRLSRSQLRQLLAPILMLPAVSLLLMLIFFTILPRTRHPLWNFLTPEPVAGTAFADQVQPGAFAELAQTRAVAFRVEMLEQAPEDLYWRGTVLNQVAGNAWRRQAPSPLETTRLTGGRPVRQVFYPEQESSPGTFLFALDLPQQLEGIRAGQAGDRVHTAARSFERRRHYQALSLLGAGLQAVGPVDRQFYLQVIDSPGPRVEGMARQLAAEGGDDRQKIARLEEFFRAQQLTYATTGLPGPEDPIEEFLFERKRGYCEFFASSFAVMLRLAGVPARLVGGYYGGEYNPWGGYYLIREDAAHVWVEALVDGREWVRLDPTGLARNGTTGRRPLGLGRQWLDAFDYWWTRTVISYDVGQQLKLLQEVDLRMSRGQWPAVGRRGWWWLLLPAGALLLLRFLWRRPSAEARILGAFRRQVERRHRLQAPPSMGLLELAEQTGDPLCRRFAEIYAGALYRDRRLSAEEKRQLRQLLRRLGESPAAGSDGPHPSP